VSTAVILIGHGSRAPEARQYFLDLAAAVRERLGTDWVEAAFMELCEPSLAAVVEQCVARGAARIVVVPVFLHPGRHLQHDIPRLVAEARVAHPEVVIELAPHLGAHPAITPLVADIVRDALTPSARR
jgi:sirohydrochlorin ferrochelatase